MIYESKVISAVCDYLERGGWDIQQKKSVYELGDDIVATRDRVELRIEAREKVVKNLTQHGMVGRSQRLK